MLKQIKSFFYFIKLKWYFKLVKAEIIIKVLDGKAIPANYFWQRLDYIIRKKGKVYEKVQR